MVVSINPRASKSFSRIWSSRTAAYDALSRPRPETRFYGCEDVQSHHDLQDSTAPSREKSRIPFRYHRLGGGGGGYFRGGSAVTSWTGRTHMKHRLEDCVCYRLRNGAWNRGTIVVLLCAGPTLSRPERRRTSCLQDDINKPAEWAENWDDESNFSA